MVSNNKFVYGLTFALILLSGSAQAATYDFRKNLPPGCSQKGNSPAQCPNGLTLQWNDVLVFDKIAEVNVTGNVWLSNAQVFLGANTPLTINATGSISSDSTMQMFGDLNAVGQISLGSDNQVQGNLNSQNQITLNNNTDVTGTLVAPQVSLVSSNTITGPISATQLTLGFNSQVTGNLNVTNNLSVGSSSSITGSINAGNLQSNSPVSLNGPIVVDNEFSLASGSTVNGSVSANRVTLAPSNSTLTGDVTANENVIIGSGNTIDGNVSAGFIRLQASNAAITGNATATGDIVIDWAGQIGGDATAVNITNNAGSTDSVGGTAFCDTSDGAQPLNCQTGSGGGGATQCDALTNLTDYGIIGLDEFEYGQNSEINGIEISDPNNTDGNTPTPDGVVEDISAVFPPLSPNVFPSFSGGDDRTNPINLAPGTYDEIEIRGNGGFASTQGGTYYIDELTFTNQSNTLQLAPGDYFIRNIDMGNNSSITISPAGTVRIFIEDELEGGNDLFFNSGGAIENLQILMYPDADFEIGNFNNASSTLTFNGILYAPYDDVSIEFGNNTNLQGAILTAGELEIGNNTSINYTDAVRDAVNEAFGCDTEVTDIHHYRIQHPLSVVSCVAAPVQVVACLDASCASRYTDTAEVTLSSSATGSTFANGGVLGFTGGQGILGLRYVDGGTTTVSLSNGAPSAQNPTECYDSAGTATTNCEIEFRTAGLIFTANDGLSAIPPSFAGTDFDVLARAVETNTQTGACEARLTGAQVLELATSCRNPLTCQAGQNFIANGANVPLNDAGATLSYANVPVTFDANGNAPLVANYSDVGALRLHGRINLSEAPNADESSIDDPEVTLTGTSVNDFVVKPHTLRLFAVDGANQSASTTTSSGSAFASAGDNFSLIITSENANGDATPNFGRETPAAEAQASYVQTLYPSTASAPASDFIGSQGWQLDTTRAGSLRTDSARWLDVGTIELAPGLNGNSYLGAGDVAAKQNATVGRFAPFRFALNTSAVANSCVAGDFTYMSEPALTVSYELYAVDSDGNITENYDSSGYSGTAEVGFAAANLAPADTATDRFADRLLNLAAQQAWTAGVMTFNAANAGFNRHPDGNIDGPFASLQLGLRVLSEIDNRNFAGSDLTLAALAGAAAPLNGTAQLRYGRLVLENTYGPENEDLSIPLYAEYFDGSRFVTHTDDSCSSALVAGLNVIADPNNLTPVAAGSDSTLTDGALPFDTLRWLAPGTGNTGEFIYEYDAPAWLEFEWRDESGAVHLDPRALGGFGQYRGNSRVLFWKEVN
ncbi:DUF6701 domain-containing protein [Pseudidiomarina sp. YC-516-91]|uniref:DUF6701 domain-containing protein n=1 Tax=Pseudidiomarina salilacus TaxID=3384452 RepID=UPI003984EBC4